LSGPVIFLCGEDELDKERRGYARAFARIAPVAFVPPGDDWQSRLDGRPVLVLNPDGRPWLPDGIERLDAPTAVFHIDTYVATSRRVRWSAMYDYTFVFHPRFDTQFRAAGIPGARLLAHAAERDLYDGPELPRRFEVGWVGRSGRDMHSARDRVLRSLTERFVTNDVTRFHTPEEMAEVYRASQVVVNISRDDWPQDANMRCFEAMAAGALLVTRVPSELSELGFEENVHFAGWRSAGDVPHVVESWLSDSVRRTEVAGRARDLVLRRHTYDARAADILQAAAGGRLAPARSWPRVRAETLRFDYHVEHSDAKRALKAYRFLLRHAPLRALTKVAGLGRLAAKRAKRMLGR
jgi:hypothetical protein